MADAEPPPTEAARGQLGHYARLQEIEQRVVTAIQAASYVMAELSKEREHMDKLQLHAAANAFVMQLQEAQQFVLQAIKAAAPDRDFEANNYFLILQAMTAAEKLDAVSVHISGIRHVLQQQQQQPVEGSPPPTADAVAMVVDADVGDVEGALPPDTT